MQSVFAPSISYLGSLPLTNIWSDKKMLLQSFSLKRVCSSLALGTQQVARMGWFDTFHRCFRAKPRKRSDHFAKPRFSQNPPSSLAYFCRLTLERSNFSKVLEVLAAQNQTDITSHAWTVSETRGGIQERDESAARNAAAGRADSVLLPLLLVLVVPRL